MSHDLLAEARDNCRYLTDEQLDVQERGFRNSETEFGQAMRQAIREKRERMQDLRTRSMNPGALMSGASRGSGYGQAAPEQTGMRQIPAGVLGAAYSRSIEGIQNRARNAIQDMHDRGLLAERTAVFLDDSVTTDNTAAAMEAAEMISARSDPLYLSAFGKIMLHGEQRAGVIMTGPEKDAVARALAMSTTASYAVPFQLDPTVINTSSGAHHPVRDIARVETIIGKTWEGVTSAGVTVSRAAEATEASDNAPTLAQPSLTPQRVQGFIPWSIEAEQDWQSLQAEMLRLLADAKEVEEATSFLTGAGTGAFPQGILTGIGTAQPPIVLTSGTADIGLEDIQPLLGGANGLPPRWRASARFVAANDSITTFSRFEKVSTVSAIQGTPGSTGDGCRLLDIPIRVWTTMAGCSTSGGNTQLANATTGDKILIYGDWSQFIVVEKMGSTEIIPHLFGASNRYPTGQRGIYFWHRSSSLVLTPTAFRVLKVR